MGYFDPENIFVDSENIYFLGWPNQYFGFGLSLYMTPADVHVSRTQEDELEGHDKALEAAEHEMSLTKCLWDTSIVQT